MPTPASMPQQGPASRECCLVITRGDERAEVLARARKQAEAWFGGPVSLRSADVQPAHESKTPGGPAPRRLVTSRWIARPTNTEKRN